jgi:hypothetical protein
MKVVVAVVALAVALIAAVPAEGQLRRVGHLEAAAKTTIVRLTWKDRARGETRYEVRRRRRKVRLRAGRTSWTDRRVAPSTRYRYIVRPCRRKRCARGRSVTVTTRRRPTSPGGVPGPNSYTGIPTVGGCPIFPADNPWNTDISKAPVDTAHDYISSLGSMTLWPDFGGSGQYGIPWVGVPFSQPLVPITFDVADESDPGPYPIPPDAPVEGGSDRHVIALRQGDCKLFEMYAAVRQDPGWHTYSGAVWDLRSNALRPETWTSADAAGLPILPGLARRDEADSGVIRHALRITVPTTQRAYIHPATHWASSNTDPNQPPMGLRLRLKASYDISALRGQARAVAQALKTYGALVADNAGSPRVYVGGEVDMGWNDDDLNGLKTIPASALEAVQTGPVVRGY